MTTPSVQILKARLEIAKEGGLLAAIQTAVQGSQWSTAELLAIGSRETGYLWGSHWGKFHDWAILGDVGHGHGVFQIDDRSHAEFTATAEWKDPLACAKKAIEILDEGKRQLGSEVLSARMTAFSPAIGAELAYAAYNCGPRNAYLGWKNHYDASIFTTGHDYGKDVLTQVGIFGELLKGEA